MVNLAKNPKNPQELTAAKAIKGGAKLTGSQLLNGTLGTESLILQYLENLAKKKAVPEYDKREVDKNSYVWKTGNSPAARVVAKAEKEKTLNPVPLIQLGLH
jgi:hypothetical protein